MYIKIDATYFFRREQIHIKFVNSSCQSNMNYTSIIWSCWTTKVQCLSLISLATKPWRKDGKVITASMLMFDIKKDMNYIERKHAKRDEASSITYLSKMFEVWYCFHESQVKYSRCHKEALTNKRILFFSCRTPLQWFRLKGGSPSINARACISLGLKNLISLSRVYVFYPCCDFFRWSVHGC